MNDHFLFRDDDGVNDVDQEASVDILYYFEYNYVCVYPDSGKNSYPNYQPAHLRRFTVPITAKAIDAAVGGFSSGKVEGKFDCSWV